MACQFVFNIWLASSTVKVSATLNIELQTSVHAGSTPASVNLFGHICQWFSCYLPVRTVSQGIVPVYRMDTCTGFPPPQQPLVLLHLGKRDFG